MEAWGAFAAITGGAAGVLLGLFFIAASLHTELFAWSQEIRNQAVLVLSLFAMALLISILIAIPGQALWMLGAELIVLAVITLYEEMALSSGNPNVVVTLSLLPAGILLVIGLRAGLYVLIVPVVAAIGFGGLQAWTLLIASTDSPDQQPDPNQQGPAAGQTAEAITRKKRKKSNRKHSGP